jgi:hypothetical protein
MTRTVSFVTSEIYLYCMIYHLQMYNRPTNKFTIKHQMEKSCKKRGWTILVEKTPEWCHCQDYLKIFGHKTSRNWDKPPLREWPFNLKGGMGYGFFLKKYSDSQCCWKKYSDFGGGKKSDSEYLSYNLMVNSGEKFRVLRDKKK